MTEQMTAQAALDRLETLYTQSVTNLRDAVRDFVNTGARPDPVKRAERNRLYQQAEALIDEEAPIAPVYFYVKSRLLKPFVKGYPYHNPQDLVYAKDLYLTAQ